MAVLWFSGLRKPGECQISRFGRVFGFRRVFFGRVVERFRWVGWFERFTQRLAECTFRSVTGGTTRS
jgi:hypothetical protein